MNLINELKNIIESKLIHTKRGNKIISSYGDWEFIHSSEAETIEDAGYGFSDGDAPNNIKLKNDNDFVGIVAHLIQQTGGSLTYKGKSFKLVDIKDTSGSTLSPNANVIYNKKKMKFKDIK